MTRTRRTWLAALSLALALPGAIQAEGEAAADPRPAEAAGPAPVPAAEPAARPPAPEAGAEGSAAPPSEAVAPDYEIFGVTVPAGQRRQLDWRVSESFAGTALPVPLHVIHGQKPQDPRDLTLGRTAHLPSARRGSRSYWGKA